MKSSNLTPGTHSLTTTPKRIADFQLAKPCLVKIENTGSATVLVAPLPKASGATLAEIQSAQVVYRLPQGEVLDDAVSGPFYLWAVTESGSGTLEISAPAKVAKSPAKWVGGRAIDLYPTKCAFQVDPKLACLTYPSSDPGTVLASTYVLASGTDTIMGVIDSGSRNTLMYQGTAGNRLTFKAAAITIKGKSADQTIPGLTSGAAAGKAVATPTSPFANVAAEGGFTVFAAVKDAYRAGLNVFAYNGNGATNIYFAKSGHGVSVFLANTGQATAYTNAVPDDLYIMAFVYDRSEGTLKTYHGTGLTSTITGIASFTPSTAALEIGGAPALGSLSQQGDLLWFSMFEGALPDNVVRTELEALNWGFGVRQSIVVCHSNSYGLIAHNTSNNTVEHCFPAKLQTFLPDDVLIKSFATSGAKVAELTTAFPTTVNPWNATSRTNQFYVLCEGTNALQTAIGVDPTTAVASVITDWSANGALAAAEGWLPILIGIRSRSIAGTATGFNTYAEEANTYARNNYRAMGFAGFVDIWNDSILGGATASTDTAKYFDGLHLTPAGHTRLAKLIADVINRLWVVAV